MKLFERNIVKMALRQIEENFRNAPATERYAAARVSAASYLRRERQKIDFSRNLYNFDPKSRERLREKWKREKLKYLAWAMRGSRDPIETGFASLGD